VKKQSQLPDTYIACEFHLIFILTGNAHKTFDLQTGQTIDGWHNSTPCQEFLIWTDIREQENVLDERVEQLENDSKLLAQYQILFLIVMLIHCLRWCVIWVHSVVRVHGYETKKD
jgi:hypothetical protein